MSDEQDEPTEGEFIDLDGTETGDEENPYLHPAALGSDEGDSRSTLWKGAAKIAALPDECIIEYSPRPQSGYIDYRMNFSPRYVSVSYRGGDTKTSFICLTHRVNDCPHTRRIKRYRAEHMK